VRGDADEIGWRRAGQCVVPMMSPGRVAATTLTYIRLDDLITMEISSTKPLYIQSSRSTPWSSTYTHSHIHAVAMTTSTLSAAAAALDSLLNGSQLSSSSAKPRRKKTVKKQRVAPSTVEIDEADLDPATRRQRELEEQRRVEEAVKALKRSAKVKEEEMEVRKRVRLSFATVGLGQCS